MVQSFLSPVKILIGKSVKSHIWIVNLCRWFGFGVCETELLFPTICSVPDIRLWEISCNYVRVLVQSVPGRGKHLVLTDFCLVVGHALANGYEQPWHLPWSRRSSNVIACSTSASLSPVLSSALRTAWPNNFHSEAWIMKSSKTEPSRAQPTRTHHAVPMWTRNKCSCRLPLRFEGCMILQQQKADW